ncbi:MAG: transcription antitermination factor NusB [Clostridiales bacterium]|nr:transcription antitermination factor NusB [Clostridiales bacterium]
MSRHTDRIQVFKLVFQTEFQGREDMLSLLEEYFEENLTDKDNRTFIENEYRGVLDNLEKIDDVINKSAINWSVERIDKADLSILRLAVYEILFSDVPGRVAANEAVELAKEFSADKSPKFINGILGKVIGDRK